MEEKLKKGNSILLIVIIALVNIALVLGAVLFTVYYSQNIRNQQNANLLATFQNNVETMKQISEQYLDNQTSIARSWAAYIQSQNMSIDEAVGYVSTVEDKTVGEAHFVDMDTFEAWSSHYTNGSNAINTYQRFVQDGTMDMYIDNMRKMMNGEKCVLCMYRIRESDRTVVSVGTNVTLRQEDGTTKDYLLLRAVLINRMRELWIFPTTYNNAEIGLITTNYDYVIPSDSMKSENFIEFVRYYNFPDDFNGADAALAEIKTQNSGLLTLNNSKKTPQACYWYYSRLQNYPEIDILGYIPVENIHTDVKGISVVYGVSGFIFLIVLIDGAYILTINGRLKKTARIADKANQSKTQFLSTMSHDIRTPLNAVLGMTELAQNKIDDKEYVRECLRKIFISGNHLLTLINDVLEISRVESGKITITPAPFDVDLLVSSLESITRSQATGHGLTFEVKADNLPYTTLVGDKLRLTQVLLNLLNNAVKYTKPGGNVSFEVREEDITDEGKLNLVCVVKDNGVGISEEFQKTMYDSFTRVSDARIDKIQGTGLGLAIVKRMVDLMDGTIDCKSAEGVGTTFTVSIPLEVSQQTVATTEETEQVDQNNDLNGIHILIAEDNEINWEIISSMLVEYGIVCERVENGQECVDKLTAEIPGTFDLVLMDIQMPVMNGLDATRALRSSERIDLQQLPIVAMTADAFAEDIQNCIDAGMNAHVAKPIEIGKVVSTIRILLARADDKQM